MKFCPKCGSMIMPKKVNGEITVECSCGYSETGVEDVTFSSKAKEDKGVAVREEDDSRLPKVNMKCEECGNNECYNWDIQTRASDEPPTRFYKCTKCKHTWREYS